MSTGKNLSELQKLEFKIEKLKTVIESYRQAINRIDDYFEYMNESAKDRERLYIILDKLTQDIKDIYK